MNGPGAIDGPHAPSPFSRLIGPLLLWLAGFCLRTPILVVAPIVPILHADLHLSQTDLGIITGLPPLMLALAAVPGALLVARLGAVQTLVGGLLLGGIGAGLRGLAAEAVVFYAATAVMSVGIAIMQPAMPRMLHIWTPGRLGFGTALYTSGLLVGETLAVAITVPFVLPLAGDSWRMAMVYWAAPMVGIGLLIAAWFAGRERASHEGSRSDLRWWPDWRKPEVWRLGGLLGGLTSLYFGANAFMPDHLAATGNGELTVQALTAINVSQLPSSFLMLGLTARLMRRRAAYVAFVLAVLVGLVGMVVAATGEWILFWCSVFGFSATAVLVLTYAFPALLSRAEDVHRVSAGMFVIGYLVAVLSPIVVGFVWDLSGNSMLAFGLLLAWPVAMVLLVVGLDLAGRCRVEAAAT